MSATTLNKFDNIAKQSKTLLTTKALSQVWRVGALQETIIHFPCCVVKYFPRRHCAIKSIFLFSWKKAAPAVAAELPDTAVMAGNVSLFQAEKKVQEKWWIQF